MSVFEGREVKKRKKKNRIEWFERYRETSNFGISGIYRRGAV